MADSLGDGGDCEHCWVLRKMQRYTDHVCKEHTGFVGHKRQQRTENDASLGRPFPLKNVHQIKSLTLPFSFPDCVIALFISIAILILWISHFFKHSHFALLYSQTDSL